MGENNNPSQTSLDIDKCCHGISVKLPDFILRDPELWLIQARSQFILAGVSKEETRYHHIVSKLPPEVLINCRDLVKEPYQPGSLQRLVDALLSRYSLTNEQRIKEVLDNIRYEVTDKPSNFFRRLISTADDLISYDLVLARFKERLPANIAATITPLTNKMAKAYKNSSTRPLEDETTMLEIADAIEPANFTAAIQQPKWHSGTASFNRSNNRSIRRVRKRSISRNRAHNSFFHSSNSRFNPDGKWCRNHFLFRDQAKKCGRPNICTFQSRSDSENY